MSMMQQINLYHPPEQAPPPKLSFKLMVIASGGLLTVLLIVFISMFAMTHFLRSEVTELKATGKQMRSELIRLSRELDVVGDENTINNEISQLQVVLANKQKAVAILKDQGLDNTIGFTGFFEALSRNHLDKTWLTRIMLIRGGQTMDLEGQAETPDLIPKMLGGLQHEPMFKGRTFKVFDVIRNDTNTVSFNIETGENK